MAIVASLLVTATLCVPPFPSGPPTPIGSEALETPISPEVPIRPLSPGVPASPVSPLSPGVPGGPVTRGVPGIPGGLWQWPLTPTPVVLRPFQPPPAPWAPGHRGVDLAATPSQPVYAAGPGRVTFAARLAGRGVVAITHDEASALRTSYVPVIPSVSPGTTVHAGTRIGVLEGGPDHCAPLLCLHWGLLRGHTYLDPLTLLCRPPIRLLPVWSPTPRPEPAGQPASPLSPPRHPQDHPMTLTSARDAAGGAVLGVPLTLTLALLWTQFRRHRPRTLPPEVIDLTHERIRRRTTTHPTTTDSSPA
jgi:Peptidase family M23